MACTHRMTRNTGDLQWCPEPPGNGHDKGSAPLQGSEGLIVLLKPGNAGGGKGPWFGYAYPMSEGGKGIGISLTTPEKIQELRRKLYHKAKQEREH